MAGLYNIRCDQGATLALQCIYKDAEGDLVDLTGYTARLQVRATHQSTTALLALTDGSGLTLGGAAGTIDVLVNATTTAALKPGDYVYDMEIVSGGTVTRLVEGGFAVTPEVTR